MNDRAFQDLVDSQFMRIEDAVDELDGDVDIDSSGGVMTLTMPNNSQVILSRQIANHEIWIAAISGGFHLRLVANEWFCETTSESLDALINRVFQEQADLTVFS